MTADLIVSDYLAEAVTKIQPACEPEVNAHVRAKHRTGGGKRRWGKRRRASRRDHPVLSAGEMDYAGPSPEIRADPAIPAAEIEQAIKDRCML